MAQQLAGAIMQFQVYDHLKNTNPEEAQKAYDGGVTLLRQSHLEARRLISGVRPPILDESGVLAAIAHLVNEQSFQGGPQILFRSNVKFNRLARVLENVVYRIVQEGLTNAARHSQSKIVRVHLLQRGEMVRIEIQDLGIGFDPKKVRRDQFGLAGIRERARLLGGKCRIQSKSGSGTRIIVELPLAEREEDE
jgi:signal transduction histidine kinase